MFLIAYVGTALIVAFLVMGISAYLAKRKGKNPVKWAQLSAFGLFVLMFWDYYPTKWTHQYYCEKEAGFWVYKTFDQWRAENPGVMETLVANKVWPHQRINGKDVAIINQRMRLVYGERDELFLHRWPDIRELVDAKNNEVLARYVDFSTSHVRGQAGWSGWKFWLHSESCVSGRGKAIDFGNYYLQFKGVGK